MLLTIFIVLTGLAIICVALGYFTEESVLTFIGLTFFFLCGIIILNDKIEFPSGTSLNRTEAYTYAGGNISNVTISQTEVTTYTQWNDGYSRTVGIFLSMAAFLGAVLFIFFKTKEDAIDYG